MEEKYYQCHSIDAKKNAGKLWQAGHSIYGLCAAWNHATRPFIALTDREHEKSRRYARAIKNRMQRQGFIYNIHYKELSNGALWPLKTK